MNSYKTYMDGVYQKIVDDHKAEAKSESEAADFIGAYVRHMEKEKDKEDTDFKGNDCDLC